MLYAVRCVLCSLESRLSSWSIRSLLINNHRPFPNPTGPSTLCYTDAAPQSDGAAAAGCVEAAGGGGRRGWWCRQGRNERLQQR